MLRRSPLPPATDAPLQAVTGQTLLRAVCRPRHRSRQLASCLVLTGLALLRRLRWPPHSCSSTRRYAARVQRLCAERHSLRFAPQLQHSFALMHSGGFPLQFPAAAASLATLSAQQAAAARPLSHFYAPPFGFPGGMLPSMALIPPPAMRAPPASHPPLAEAVAPLAAAPDAGHAQQAGAAVAATTATAATTADAGQANGATPSAAMTEITVAV